MNDNKTMILILKGVISELPEAEQQEVRGAHAAMEGIVEAHGKAGLLALALLGCEKGEE